MARAEDDEMYVVTAQGYGVTRGQYKAIAVKGRRQAWDAFRSVAGPLVEKNQTLARQHLETQGPSRYRSGEVIAYSDANGYETQLRQAERWPGEVGR